ncbi:MAG: hypothetical protein EA417_22560 [Gammaproteobacteria bacterium]|nr:MAG: hypothetical protein EA417_22560 [Gammaproteobacteria bacterium]
MRDKKGIRIDLENLDQDPRVEWAVRLAMGVTLMLVGMFLVALALGYQPRSGGQLQVPPWVGAIAGVLLMGGGVAVLLPKRRSIGWLIAMVILAGSGAISLWIGLFGDPAEISGGLPLLPESTNQTIGRVMFTLGGIICLAILAYGLWLGPGGRGRKPTN